MKTKKILLVISFAIAIQLSYAGWQWLNPYPQGNNLIDLIEYENSIMFIGPNETIINLDKDSSEFYLMGTIGFDEGAILTSVAQCDQNIFITTGSGKIYKSTDWENWELVFTEDNYCFYDIVFTGEIGFAIGYSDLYEENLLVKTENAGLSWEVEQFGSFLDEVFIQFIRIHDNIVYAGGMACILTTEISENDWELFYLDEDSFIYDFYMLDSDNIFISGENENFGFVRRLDSQGSLTGTTLQDTLHSIFTLEFYDNQQGVAAGDFGFMAITNDGGVSWDKIDTQTNAIVGNIISTENGFYCSGSGGLFGKIDQNDETLNSYSGICSNGTITSIEKSDNLILACGYNNLIIVSFDNGENWQQINIDWADHDPDLVNYSGLNITDNLIAIYGTNYNDGSGVRVVSDPLCEIWEIDSQTLPSDIFDCCFTNNSTGYYISGISIYKTVDAGDSWYLLYSSNIMLSAINFLDDYHGYATDCAGRILKTNDGGLNWSIFATGVPQSFTSISIVDIETAYICSHQFCYKTDNGGESWDIIYEIPWDDRCNIKTVYFSDQYCGYLQKDLFNSGIKQSQLLHTIDGGLTWTQLDIPFCGSINNISEIDDNIYFCGEFANLLRFNENTIAEDQTIFNKSLLKCYPNPFKQTTSRNKSTSTISYTVENDSFVELDIFNVKGQKIKAILSEYLTKGTYSTSWFGDDNYGLKVSSGVYLFILTVDNQTVQSKKCLLLK